METALIITDLTRMHGKRVCIAGINKERQMIRPIIPGGIMEDWLFINNQAVIRPFARVHLDLLEAQPQPPHSEDYLINPQFKLFVGLLEEKYKKKLLDEINCQTVTEIFGTFITHDHGFYIPEGKGEHSLGTLWVKQIEQVTNECYNSKWDYRIAFVDSSNSSYRLSVTDLVFRNFVDNFRRGRQNDSETLGRLLTNIFINRDVYLRVGLARGWDKFPDRCYLQITGIYTFPDYLEGKCFADYPSKPIEGENALF
jgi:hypothetical protein